MSRPPYWCPCGAATPVGDVAAMLLPCWALRRTADAAAAGEHVLNAARPPVLGNNAAFCSSRFGDPDAFILSQWHCGTKKICSWYRILTIGITVIGPEVFYSVVVDIYY